MFRKPIAVLMTVLLHATIVQAQSDIAVPAAPAQEQTPAQEQPLPQEPPQTEGVFTVGDIRIEGLQRISEGTVYNYLPVNIGDKLDERRLQEALKALYATGFFRDVELRRDGNTLVVAVLERPSIESFEIKGNKDIKTEELQKNLRNAGLATGKTFDRSVLDEITQGLTDMYFSRGKYGVKLDAKVEEVPGNKVKITIDIKEGKRAKIRQINIVGNKRFKEKQILGGFELKTPNLLSFYKQNDRYSRESLQGDLEKLRSFYMDRGYANFQVDSTQVAITPEKDDIFITLNIDEGEVFKVSEVKLAGSFVVPEADLKQYLLVQPGQTFNRKLITSTQELLQNRLGVDGYAFAKIEPVPTPNNETNEVSLTFFMEPGNRVYVRHINFLGAKGINDETLRREMRQMEGAWLSNVAVDRSKQRIQQRMPYVKKVESETTPVPGSPDLVDVDFTIEEGPSASLQGGVGYSESYGIMLNGSYADSNFLGTGERIAFEINSGRYSKVYSFSHTNPYVSVDNLMRTFSVGFRDVSQFVSASSDFSSKMMSAGLTYSYPITEYQNISLGTSLQSNELLVTTTGSARQAVDWVLNNGNPSLRTVNDPLFGTVTFASSKFKTADLILGWSYEGRNRALFPTAGARHSVSLSYTVPGSEIEYSTLNYDYSQFLPLWRNFVLGLNGELGYSKALGDTTAPPPYRNFYGGGPNSVRGFQESRLGPKDNFGNPYGGDLKVIGRVELIIPIPQKFQSAARASLFYDIGNIFYEGKETRFTDKAGFPVDYSFDLKQLRSSIGLGVQWLAPLGLFQFSYSIPQRYRKGTELNYGDQLEGFQFTIGQAF